MRLILNGFSFSLCIAVLSASSAKGDEIHFFEQNSFGLGSQKLAGYAIDQLAASGLTLEDPNHLPGSPARAYIAFSRAGEVVGYLVDKGNALLVDVEFRNASGSCSHSWIVNMHANSMLESQISFPNFSRDGFAQGIALFAPFEDPDLTRRYYIGQREVPVGEFDTWVGNNVVPAIVRCASGE